MFFFFRIIIARNNVAGTVTFSVISTNEDLEGFLTFIITIGIKDVRVHRMSDCRSDHKQFPAKTEFPWKSKGTDKIKNTTKYKRLQKRQN